ncbi:hypothetical protein FRC08_015403 [Ceratobasidium sp. 394]|nr:hypothetical protein FRC08_015403 [Ceratobasidium sp. 394]
MPLPPLAKIPLLFLVDAAVDLGDNVYDVHPWTNGPFREACGLKPLRDDSDEKSGNVEERDRYANVADGFVLTDEAMQSVEKKDRGYFTIEASQQITSFLAGVQKHASQLREGQLNLTDEKSKKRRKRKKKDASTPDDDSSDEDTFIDRAHNIAGFAEFKGAWLGMLNRAGGVMAEVIRVMTDADRTPMKAWRNYVYTSQNLPSRANKQLSEEEREKQRLDEIEAKKRELKYCEPPAIGRYLDGRLTIRVASVLFGADAFMPSSDIVWDCFHNVTNALIRRAWERQQRGAKATLKKGATRRQEYQQALQDAIDKPCPRLLRKASECLKRWKDIAEITGESGESSFVDKAKALEDLWGDLGYLYEPDSRNKRPRAGRRKLQALATKEQMEAAYSSYREQHFSDMDGTMKEMTEVLGDFQALDGSDPSAGDTVAVDLLDGTGNRDLGVDEFARAQLSELIRLLGIGNTGALPMASEELRTKWHQLVGIATMLKRMFTINLGDAPCPSLLCDDVGLGKTAQILGTICMLVHCIELQDAGRDLPPLISESSQPYFAGLERIERRPSMIVVPLTLVQQWYEQLKHFTADGAFQIIIYSKEYYDPVQFFEVGGLWDKVTKGKTAHRTILIVPISTIAAEARRWLETPPKGAAGRTRAFRGDIMDLASDIPSILSKKFLLFAGDEFHNFRNLNYSHVVNASLHHQDLAALGRLLRHRPMIGQAGYELGMAMLKSEQTKRSQIKRGAQGDASESGLRQIERFDTQDPVLAGHLANACAKNHRTFFIHRESIDMAKDELMPIIIRRTGRSLDAHGKTVLDIEPYIESVAWCRQQPRELEVVEKRKELLMKCEQEGDTKEMQVIWKASSIQCSEICRINAGVFQNFLLDHKNALFHWRLLTWNQTSPPFWERWTTETLQEDASSKILMAISLVKHYQDPNAKPLFYNSDGTPDPVKQEECICRPAKKPRALATHFALLSPCLMPRPSQALSLVGVESIEYDGHMSPTNRDKALQQFEREDGIRVLLISNVGTTGLNLTTASVVIFLSGLWSGMEIKQTIGRAWRAGQLEIVIVHHIFAPSTADVLLATLAGDKVLMLDHLYEAGSIAQKVFEAPRDIETEAESGKNTEDAPAGGATKSKAPVRSRKRPAEAGCSSSSSEARPSKKGKTPTTAGDAITTGAQPYQPPVDPQIMQPTSAASPEPSITATYETEVSSACPSSLDRHASVPGQTSPSAVADSVAMSGAPSSRVASPVARSSSPVRTSSPINAAVQSPASSPSSVLHIPDHLAHPVEQSVETNTASPVPATDNHMHAMEEPRSVLVPYDAAASTMNPPTLPDRPKASARVTTASTAAITRQPPTITSERANALKPVTGKGFPIHSHSTPPTSNSSGRPSSSQGQLRDPRLVDLPTQSPGQFRLKSLTQSAAAPKPITTGKRVLRSPPRTARRSIGAVVRPSGSSLPDANGKDTSR